MDIGQTIEEFMNNEWVVTIIGGIVVAIVLAIGAWIGKRAFRRRKIEEKEGKERKELEADHFEEAFRYVEKFRESLQRQIQMMEELGKKFLSVKIGIDSHIASDELATAAHKYELVKGLSSDMIEFADNFEVELQEMHDSWEKGYESLVYFIHDIDVENKKTQERLKGLILTLEKGLELFKNRLPLIRDFRKTIVEYRTVSNILIHPVRRVTVAIDREYDELLLVKSCFSLLISLINEKLSNY